MIENQPWVDPETRARHKAHERSRSRIEGLFGAVGGVGITRIGIVLTIQGGVMGVGDAIAMIGGGIAATTFGVIELRKQK